MTLEVFPEGKTAFRLHIYSLGNYYSFFSRMSHKLQHGLLALENSYV